MKAEFAILLMNVCRKLREKSINFEDLQTFLTGCFSPGECIPEAFNMNKIFEAITRHKLWDFWNYYALERIVQAVVADDPDISSWIETYKQQLKAYKITTKLIDQIAATNADSDYVSPSEERQPARYDQQYYQKLSLKLKMSFTDHTLDYIDDLWNEYAELYGLPSRVALLDSIHDGCVSIVWLIPSHLAPQIRSTTPHSADFYRKHEITRVELGEEYIYQEKEEHQKVYML